MTQANIKYAKGYAASGVGAVICSRHEMMLANGVGDTQLGEKYIQTMFERRHMLTSHIDG